MGDSVGKRFGQMLKNIKDWWISFGSHVCGVGFKKMEIGWNLEFSFGKKNSLPGKEDYRLFKNFSRDIFLFFVCPPFFSLFVVVN